MFKPILSVLLSLAVAGLSSGQADKPLLLRRPSVSRNQIAFCYGGDICLVGRQGGEAQLSGVRERSDFLTRSLDDRLHG